MNVNQVLNEVESIIKPMKRIDAMLTPEECRLYERYSVEQVQAMAMATPAVKQPENALQDVTGDYDNIDPGSFWEELSNIEKGN